MLRSRRASELRELQEQIERLSSRLDSLDRRVELLRDARPADSDAGGVIVVQEMTKEAVRARALDVFDKLATTDIAELHQLVGCDVRLLAEVLDELRAEGRIEEA